MSYSANKAIVLVSGGLDSTTTLAIAKDLGFDCYALSFDYDQRHISELNAARKIVDVFDISTHEVINLDMGKVGGSALTDKKINVPEGNSTEGIPITYVPARNTIFLSYALAYAEVIQANDIFIGVNAVDYSGYPDCRPEFIKAYEQLATLATKSGVEGQPFKIHTPLMSLSKSDIIKKGVSLNIDYGLTVSCYQADSKGHACGYCDSCRFRKEGFESAGIVDPTRYQ